MMASGYDLKFSDGTYIVVNCNSEYDEVVLSNEELKLKIVNEIKKFEKPIRNLSFQEKDQLKSLHRLHAAVCRKR